jgi:hypothetical protein
MPRLKASIVLTRDSFEQVSAFKREFEDHIRREVE